MKFFADPFRNKYLPLFALILFFLAIRLLILFSGVDNLIYHEEIDIGTAAKIQIDGISPTLISRHANNYRWGGIILGILTVPFFLLFGDSLVVLRAVPMLFSLGTLVLLYLLLFNFFNRRAAILASLLFILSPPNYIKGSFVATGGYTEINFFSILAIFLFYKIFFGEGANRKYLYAFFGIVSGFALYYDYTFLLTLSCCLLFWFTFDKGILLKKNFHIFVLFFLIGFSLWFYHNLTHNWNALFIMRDESLLSWYTKNSFLHSLIRIKDLVIFNIPSSFSFKDFFFLSENLVSYTYYFILASSFIGLFWLQRKAIAGFFWGLIPLRRFRMFPGMISRETFLIIYVVMFVLAYAFCGTSYLSKREGDLVFPHRFVIFMVPALFMITSIFLTRITNNKYGIFISRVFASVLILIGLINNVGMISMQNYRISALPDGFNYIDSGHALRRIFGDSIEQFSDFINKIDKKYRRFFYDGYKWAVPIDENNFSVKDYVQKKIMGSIDKGYWPFAYENLGKVIGQNLRYSKDLDEELKSSADKVFYPYFYIGLGRSFINKGIDEREYNYIYGIIDKQYWRYFHEGMGIEMDIMFIDDHQKFSQFMSTIDTEAKRDIYAGFAKGREYPRMSYDIFQAGFRKIAHSIKEWKKRVTDIEEEFRSYCYQRLGIEMGWRFIYDIKGYRKFLQKVDEEYRPYMYRGLGTAIGWRFGYKISGCILLIKQVEQRYWTYIYEGLGTGVANRYGYQLDERLQDIEAEKISVDYRDQFRKGLKEAAEI